MLILLQCYVCFNAKITLNNTIVAPDNDMDTLEMETVCHSNQSHRVTFSIKEYLFICAFSVLQGNHLQWVTSRGEALFFFLLVIFLEKCCPNIPEGLWQVGKNCQELAMQD